jgi:stage III sporulation protein AE
MKIILFIILLLPGFCTTAYAENTDSIYEQATSETEIYNIESALPDSAQEISGALRVDGSYNVESALKRLWTSTVDSFKNALNENIKVASSLVAIAVLCALSGSICNNKPIKEYINIAGCCAVAVTLMGSVNNVIDETVSAINQLSDYSKVALPAVFTAAASCGAVTSAATKYAAVCLTLNVLMNIAQKLVIPMVYYYLALALAGSVFPNSLLSNTARLVRWIATTAMTAMTLTFSAYIGITGLVSGSVDAAAIKAARTVISTSLPVVGGLISDASATVLSAAGIIKSSVGAFGLIAVCALCAGPFTLLSVKMLVLKAAAAASDLVPNGRLAGLIDGVGTAMGLLLGLLGSFGIMLFISIMSAIKAVGV